MADLEGDGDADEGSFIELLIASERVDNWMTALREHEDDLNRCARAPHSVVLAACAAAEPAQPRCPSSASPYAPR